MDYFLVSLGIIFVLLGIAGCILPVLPGPPLSFISLIFLQLTSFADFETDFLILLAVIAVVVTILDYVFPVWITKKTGGTRAGVWGAFLGLLAGLFFFPPIGIIVGPFIGALLGELLQGSDNKHALRAGFGSFLGFLLGVGLKLITSLVMSWYFFKELAT
jgi:uncharacterized protein